MQCPSCGGDTAVISGKTISGMGTNPKVVAFQYQCKECLKLGFYKKEETKLSPEEAKIVNNL